MQEIVYTLVKEKEAVDDAIYERFYVPSIVQKVINSMTGVAYDFSSTRLTKSSPESSEKRKKLDEERKIRPTA